MGGNMRKKTTREFIDDAILVHGSDYDYSKVEYVNKRTKVIIICPIHGEFLQNADSHLRGRGCDKCGGSANSSTEEFIEKSRVTHGNKFDYSKVVYEGNKQKVIIVCPDHGEFQQMPNSHLLGYGCAKCGVLNIIDAINSTTEEFIEKAVVIHGDKYDYSKVDYSKSKHKVIIVCPEHGEFLQSPSSHLIGCGCVKCAGRYQPTTEEFIENVRTVHGDKYDYSKVNYVTTKVKVIIVCPEHGEFKQTPHSHLQGQGCPACNPTCDNDTLYLWQADGIYHNGHLVYKVGITSQRLQDVRIRNVAKTHGYRPINIVMAEIANASEIEAIIKRMGTVPANIRKQDGFSEFRAFTPDEYYSALSLIGLFASDI